MLYRLLEPIARPFWAWRSKINNAKAMKSNVRADMGRVKNMKNQAMGNVNKAKQAANRGKQGAQKASGVVGGQIGGARAPGAPQMPTGGMPMSQGAGPQAGAEAPRPGIRKKGLFRKRHYCNVCQQELDKTWQSCPYCAQNNQPQVAKTQAFIVDHASGHSMQLLGWLVSVAGPQRGELFTLAPMSTIGTDPSCTVVLIDQYMSGQHAQIIAESGVWVVKDMGSTNGTFVNDKRVDKRELVDNDFVKFGNSLLKFKSL